MNDQEFQMLDSMEMGLMILDDSLNIHFWNHWLESNTGIKRDTALSQPLDSLFSEIKKRPLLRKIRSALTLNSPTYYCGEHGYLIKIPFGRIANPVFEFMQQSVSIVPSDINKRLVIVAIHDQTPLREIQNKLESKIQEIEDLNDKLVTDSLTGLPTRPQLLEDVKNTQLPSLSFISVESFREINDLYGHHIGDQVLITLGEKIKNYLSDNQFKAYRMPGDEYAILARGGIDPKEFHEFIRKLVTALNDTNIIVNSIEIPLTVAAGIGYYKESLLRDTDIALQKAKSDKKHSCVLFDDSIDCVEELEQNLLCINAVKRALSSDQILPYFQPIVNLKTGKVEKYEALVRLVHEDGKVWSPFVFLLPSKKARLYHHITKKVIEKSLQQFQNEKIEFSINLSVEDILNGDTVHYLNNALEEFDMHDQTVLEITESEGIENFNEVSAFIRDMQEKGCKIAIDDFGSGYSNFEYLIRMNVDYIKIDGSIIRNMDTDSNCRIVTETIVEFANRLGIKTIAEFVHSEEILSIAKSLGIDYGQGFYLGEPGPAPEI